MDVSTLALLEAGVLLVDHVQTAFATYDHTVGAAFLDSGFDFHRSVLCVPPKRKIRLLLFVSICYSSLGQVVGRHLHLHSVSRQDLDVVHPHLTGNMGYDLVAVFQFHAKHRVGEGFDHGSVLFYIGLFCQGSVHFFDVRIHFHSFFDEHEGAQYVGSALSDRYGMLVMRGGLTVRCAYCPSIPLVDH